jgi:transcriptional regulator with XRE-family HTH domain
MPTPSESSALAHLQTGPTVLRMLVGTRLRQLRETAEISRADAGYAIRASHAKISRLELGRTSFKRRDVADLLTLYGVRDQAERDAVLALVEQANTHGWWHAYADVVPGWFQTYLGLEQAAGMIRTWEVQLVPGLLQTADYARAVIRLNRHLSADEVERRVELRMRRQHVLDRPEPTRLWAVIDEAALRRPIGGAATMRAQIEHLIRLCALPHVTVQVLPFSAGGHAGVGGPVTILRFPQDMLPDVVYLEQLAGAFYLDKAADITYYSDILNSLVVDAESPSATLGLLRRLLAEG